MDKGESLMLEVCSVRREVGFLSVRWWSGGLALVALSCLGSGLLSAPLTAQESVPADDAPAAATSDEETSEEPTSLMPALDWGFEVKAHYRDSDAAAFPSPFPFSPGQLPPGQTQAFLTPPSPGAHFELSVVTLSLDATWGDDLVGRVKVDVIDLHDRNPTSSDKKVDVDEAWIRFGYDPDPGALPGSGGAYAKVGKFGKFERQDDRHLESYGLVSTAFNRFEDLGLEVGLNLGKHFYLKGSYTAGNPLFMRDPNALAGDNGTPETLLPRPFNTPRYGTGLVILYDAEVEDSSFDGAEELGLGVGARFGDGSGRRGIDVLAWAYQRDLAPSVTLEGTFYGGDLNLLDGAAAVLPSSLPIRGNEKSEVGANLWLYHDALTVFAQYVDQEVAGMDRQGYEAELAYRFELPLIWSVGGQQLFPSIAPAVRYSYLKPEFDGGSPLFPAPSLRWEWTKVDYGVRLGIIPRVDLTLEFADNTFVVRGVDRSADEFLATLHFGL